MKKYITIAALLAAGTAFANAETQSFDIGDVWGSYYSRGRFNAQELKLSSLIGENALASYELESFYFLKTSENVNFADYLAIVDPSEDYKICGLSTSSELATGQSFGGASGKALEIYSFKETVWLNTTKTYLAVFLSSVDGLVAGSVLNFDNVANLTSQTGNVGSPVSPCDGTAETLGLAKVLSYDNNTSSFSVSNFKVTDSIAAVTAPYGVTVVPEPSAFGMLAGLGALTLVASRRRRR